MSRLLHRILAGTVILSAGVIATTGCVDNDSSLFIQGVLRPEAPECKVTPEPGSTFIGTGVLDTAFSKEYHAWLLVGNQMTPRGTKGEARTETMRIRLNGAIVQLQNLKGDNVGDEFSVPGSGFVSISSSEDPGYGAFEATLVPASTGSSFGGSMLIAKVRVYGETLGGQELESADFNFPIQVCSGCTVTFPAEALDTNGCCTMPGGPAPPCFAGEDIVDCRSCAGDIDPNIAAVCNPCLATTMP